MIEVEYGDGLYRVPVQERGRCCFEGRVAVDVVRASERLGRWHERWLAEGSPEFRAESDTARSLLAALGDALEPFTRGEGGRWVATSVIHRDTRDGSKGAAKTVHRDLCDTAVANLSDVRAFVNAWIPLRPVHSHPLALLDPNTCDPRTQAAPYRAVSAADRSGLNYDASHAWFWCPRLGPADALLWRSDLVYHASFDLAGQDDFRRSCDVRFHYVASGEEEESSRRGGGS
mmetsp:Transcript_15270/g.46265  ORF Transcript_15270/g.46265 Transcript_15270/m.46265 type:complete len:231 (+) Transcript_15270:3-695(+)